MSSENSLSFFGAGGHSHDGVNSTLIDTRRYSLFDFSLGYKGSQTRINTQSTNQSTFEEYIIRIVNQQVLQPAGLNLDPDTLNGKTIRANTITANQIASNTITANELTSNIVLVNNIIRSNNYVDDVSGWRISSNGNAEFNDVKIRGDLITGSGVFNNVNTPLFANRGGHFSLGNKITWDGSTLTINGSVNLAGTNIGTFDNGDSLTGGSIAGLSISPDFIGSTDFDNSGQGFRIYANGFADFNEVSVVGHISASSGDIGGVSILSSSLQSSNFNGTTEGFSLLSNGFANFRRLQIGENLSIGTTVRVNGPTGDGGASAFKVRSSGNTFSTSSFSAQSNLGGSTNNILSIRDNGTVRLFEYASGALSIDSTGVITVSGSSRDIKENIENIIFDSLNFIKKLKPVTFTYARVDSDSDFTYQLKQLERHVGFIVEDIEDVQSEIGASLVRYSISDTEYRRKNNDREFFTIKEDFEKIKPTMYYETAILSLTVKSIQDLVDKIQVLEDRLQALEDV